MYFSYTPLIYINNKQLFNKKHTKIFNIILINFNIFVYLEKTKFSRK